MDFMHKRELNKDDEVIFTFNFNRSGENWNSEGMGRTPYTNCIKDYYVQKKRIKAYFWGFRGPKRIKVEKNPVSKIPT